MFKFNVILTFTQASEKKQRIYDQEISVESDETFLQALLDPLDTEDLKVLIKISTAMESSNPEDLPQFLWDRNGKYFFNVDVNKDQDTAKCRKQLLATIQARSKTKFSKARLDLEQKFRISPKSRIPGADKNRSPLNVVLTVHDTLLRGDTKKQSELVDKITKNLEDSYIPLHVYPDVETMSPECRPLKIVPWTNKWWQVVDATLKELHPEKDKLRGPVLDLIANSSLPIHFGCVEACETCQKVVAILSKK